MIKKCIVRRIILLAMGVIFILGLYGCSTQNMSADPETKKQEEDTSLSKNIKNQPSDVEEKNQKDHINDLLFRKYNIGYSMPEGNIIIKKDEVLKITSNQEAVIVVFYNDQILETLQFEGEDLSYEIEKGGHYCFFVLNSDKTLTDISDAVAVYKDIEDSIVTPLDD